MTKAPCIVIYLKVSESLLENEMFSLLIFNMLFFIAGGTVTSSTYEREFWIIKEVFSVKN